MLSPSEASTWQTVYNISYYVLLGALFVSFVTTGLTFIANNRLSNDLTERLTLTTDQAGKANQRAGQLEKEAADARVEQERIKGENLKLQQALDAVRQTTDRTKQAVASRELTDEQRQAIAKRMAAAAGTRALSVTTTRNDEAMQFAQQIAAALQAGGATASVEVMGQIGLAGSLGDMDPAYGVSVTQGCPPDVVAALKEAGLEPRLFAMGGHIETAFGDIFVGLKPKQM